MNRDKKDNASFGKVLLKDTAGSIIYNTEQSTVGTIGIRDIIVVNTENGVLVCNKKDAENVKRLKLV